MDERLKYRQETMQGSQLGKP